MWSTEVDEQVEVRDGGTGGVVLLTGNASLILESDDELEEKAGELLRL